MSELITVYSRGGEKNESIHPFEFYDEPANYRMVLTEISQTFPSAALSSVSGGTTPLPRRSMYFIR